MKQKSRGEQRDRNKWLEEVMPQMIVIEVMLSKCFGRECM